MDELYESLIKGVRKSKHKVALFLCGTAGSGKTSSLQHILRDVKLTTTYVYINVDLFRDKVKNYYDVQELAYRAMKDGYSIVWDKTCRNTGDTMREIQEFKKHGYRTITAMLYVSLNTALDRVSKRTTQEVPEDVVRSIFRELSKKAERYMGIADEVFLYNNEHTLTLLFHREKKEITCVSNSKFYFDVSKYC